MAHTKKKKKKNEYTWKLNIRRSHLSEEVLNLFYCCNILQQPHSLHQSAAIDAFTVLGNVGKNTSACNRSSRPNKKWLKLKSQQVEKGQQNHHPPTHGES